MRKYNWNTNEYEELEEFCDGCGLPIDGNKGMQIVYKDTEDGKRVKMQLGSCCAGKINAYGSISKSLREAYKNQGQISENILSKNLPLAPKPDKDSSKAGKQIHEFVDKIGRSKLSKAYDAQIKYRKNKSLKDN
jgi:hypothetical protein